MVFIGKVFLVLGFIAISIFMTYGIYLMYIDGLLFTDSGISKSGILGLIATILMYFGTFYAIKHIKEKD